MHKISVQITTPYLLVNPTTRAIVSGATIACSVYDETDTLHASGNMTEVGATGLYYYNWTPNAVGVWKVVISCASPVSNHSFIYHVGSGIEADIWGEVDTEIASIISLIGTPALADMSADIASVWALLSHANHGLAALRTEIDNNETDINTNETKIDNLNTDLATHDNDIKSLLNDATYGLSALETLVDEVESLLKHGTYGLAALDAELGTHDTDIKALLNHATYGLSALKTEIDANETKIDTLTTNLATHDTDIKAILNHATYGLSAIETLVDDLESRLTATRAGYLDELDFDLDARLGTPTTSIAADIADLISRTKGLDDIHDDLGTHDTALGTHDTDIKALLNHATYGLSAIETLVDDLESRLTATRAGYLDELDFDLDARLGTPSTSLVADIAADFDRHLTKIDCWSDEEAIVTITGGSTDVNLPSVIIPTLPTGATIWKVVLLFKCDLIKDTSGSDNAINGAAAIRVKKSTGTWGVDDIVAYDIQDNLWGVDVSEATERGGDAFVGNLNNDDLSGEVDAAATYNLRFEDIQADGANLLLHSVAVGLRVYIY